MTVSILGSAVVLVYKGYRSHEINTKVRGFISSLENRTPQELADRVDELKRRPKVAERVLPELRRTLRTSRSEGQLCAAISISRAFMEEEMIEAAVFELRTDPRESVSAAAVAALAEVSPPERAAEILGKCLEGAETGGVPDAAVDEAVRGLFNAGAPGLGEMKARLAVLGADRRAWIAGYVNTVGGPNRREWLEMLAEDEDEAVRSAARRFMVGEESARAEERK